MDKKILRKVIQEYREAMDDNPWPNPRTDDQIRRMFEAEEALIEALDTEDRKLVVCDNRGYCLVRTGNTIDHLMEFQKVRRV